MKDISKDLVVGVDLGATNIRAGLVENSVVVKQAEKPVPINAENAYVVVDALIKTIEQVMNPAVKGIGIGIPSLVDRRQGIVYYVQNIPTWKTVYLKKILEDHFRKPVYLDNDCNCFAIGERLYGQGRQFENFVGITLGTGMGSGIINNGKLIKDANCGSGEFGSIPYLDGIYEDYCSGKFFRTFYKDSGENLAEMARRKDPRALKAYSEFGKHLGVAIKSIMFALDPEMVIIGGSITKSAIHFESSMMDEIRKFPYPQSVLKFRVLFSSLLNPGILGAAALYFDAQNGQG
jgi:glucokinase